MNFPKYSILVAVYNRAPEVKELLESLTHQQFKDFEVVIVEDGSEHPCSDVCALFADKLALHYYFKPNTGPGPTRNYGMEKAHGTYFMLTDSDCILPPDYFLHIEKFFIATQYDVWGGPDRGHKNFSFAQRTMAFTMTSYLLTGGIRGAKTNAGWQPRSYNMGLHRRVFEATKGFGNERIAEDSILAIRIKEMGFTSQYINEAYVYHKRRATWQQFFKQVTIFGKGRVQIGRRYPNELRWIHWIPVVFILSLICIPIIFFIDTRFGFLYSGCIVSFFVCIALEGLIRTKSFVVALLSIPSALIQLVGYGIGFCKEKFVK